MKTKGISIWEQHLERFVLAIAVLVFIGLTTMQFIGSPNNVTIDGREVPPDEVDEIVKERAERLLGRLAPEASPAVEIADPDPVLDVFNDLRVASTGRGDRLGPVQYQVVLGSEGGVTPTGEPFHVPEIPLPYQVAAEQYFDALSTEAREFVDDFEALQAMVPELPHDLTWATAAAKFDVGHVLREYQATGESGQQPLPLSWYKNRVDLLDVRVEREEYADGSWGGRTVLEPIPGQVSYRLQLVKLTDAAGRDRILEQVADPVVQNDIIRPEFYPTLNATWAPPVLVDEDAAETPLNPELARLTKMLKGKRGRLEQVRELLEKLGGGAGGDAGAGGRAGAGGGAVGGGGGGGDDDIGGGGGTGGGRGGGAGAGVSSDERRRRRLKGQETQLLEKIASLETRIAAIAGANAPVVEEADDEPAETLVVWAHDLTVEPGRTYRYRFSVEVFNPFFGRRISLVEEQHHLADGMTRQSPASEWSGPLAVEPPLRVYVVRASAPEEGRGRADVFGSASCEVYRFSDGRWWENSFRVEPGQRIGEVKNMGPRDGEAQEIDFRTDWFLLDVIEVLDTDRAGVEKGWGARVLLQHLASPELIEERDPRIDYGNALRGELKDQVDLAASVAVR